MSKFLLAAIAGTALSIASSSVFAEELIVTTGAAKGRSSVALDFSTNGEAVGFQFNIDLPEGVSESQVDLKSCVADLPKTHAGQCSVAKGQIIGLVYSDQNAKLPSGLVSVGRISFGANVNKALKVSEVLVSDANANPIRSSAKVVADGVDSVRPGQQRIK